MKYGFRFEKSRPTAHGAASRKEQTLHFQLKDDISHDDAVRLVRLEVERYKNDLSRKGVFYKIDSKTEQPDGSVILKIRKQNLRTPVGEYMN